MQSLAHLFRWPKILLIVIPVVVASAGILGYLWLASHLSASARDRIDVVLVEASKFADITYDEVSVSPIWQTVTINGLRIKAHGEEVTLDSVEIRDWDDAHKVPHEFDVVLSARQLPQVFQAAVAGVVEESAAKSVRLAWRLGDDGKLEIDAALDIEGLGAVSTQVTLLNINLGDKPVKAGGTAQGWPTQEALIATSENGLFKALSVSVTDLGIRRVFLSSKVPADAADAADAYESTYASLSKEQRKLLESVQSFVADQSGNFLSFASGAVSLSPRDREHGRIHPARQALATWIERGGTLDATVTLKPPVRISEIIKSPQRVDGTPFFESWRQSGGGEVFKTNRAFSLAIESELGGENLDQMVSKRISALIAKGGDINAFRDRGVAGPLTLLTRQLLEDDASTAKRVQFLLSNGALVNAPNADGTTALQHALLFYPDTPEAEVIAVLRKAGGKVPVRTYEHFSTQSYPKLAIDKAAVAAACPSRKAHADAPAKDNGALVSSDGAVMAFTRSFGTGVNLVYVQPTKGAAGAEWMFADCVGGRGIELLELSAERLVLVDLQNNLMISVDLKTKDLSIIAEAWAVTRSPYRNQVVVLRRKLDSKNRLFALFGERAREDLGLGADEEVLGFAPDGSKFFTQTSDRVWVVDIETGTTSSYDP